MKKSIFLSFLFFLVMSCESDKTKLTKHLINSDIKSEISCPIKYSNEVQVDSINVEYLDKFKLITFINLSYEFQNNEDLQYSLNSYKEGVIKDIKKEDYYQLYKDNDLTLEYNIYLNKIYKTKFIIKSSEY